MISVFYDGQCGLCSREINYYRRIAPPGVFDWVDLTRTPARFESLGLRVDTGLRILHVQDAQQRLHAGVDAFIVIWRALPYWRWLAPIVALPPLRWIAAKAYRLFADWRFKHMGYGSCKI